MNLRMKKVWKVYLQMAKILVVDDDIAINELIKVNLELQGYTVVQA